MKLNEEKLVDTQTIQKPKRLNELKLMNSELDKLSPETRERVKDAAFFNTLTNANDTYDYIEAIKERTKKGSRYEDAIRSTAKGLASIGSAFQNLAANQGMYYIPSSGGVAPILPKEEAKIQKITQEGQREVGKSADLLWRITNSPDLAMTNDDIFAKATDMIGQTLPYIASTAIGGLMAGPAGAFAVGASVEGNSAYRTALDNGVEEKKAQMIGVGVGIISGAIETVGFKGVEKLFETASKKFEQKLLQKAVIDFTGATIVEALEEGAQEITSITGEKFYRDVDWNEAVTRTLGSMAGGAFLGGAVKGGSIAFRQSMLMANEKPAKIPQEYIIPEQESAKPVPSDKVETPASVVPETGTETQSQAEVTGVKIEDKFNNFINKYESIFITPSNKSSDITNANDYTRKYAQENPEDAIEIASQLRKNAIPLSERENGLSPERYNSIASELEKTAQSTIERNKSQPTPTQPEKQVQGEVGTTGRPIETAQLSERTETLAIEKNLTKNLGQLPTYETMNMKEQANLASQELQDFQNAFEIAMGRKTPANPELRPASVYEAVKYKLVQDGNIDMLRTLATQSSIPSELSQLGQQIKAADTGREEDAVKAIQSIVKTREDVYNKRVKKDIKKEKKSIAKSIKEEIKKSSTVLSDWNAFIEGLQC